MCCATEVPEVRRLLRKLDSVRTIQVNVVTKTVTITHASLGSGDPSHLAQALTSGGFQARILSSHPVDTPRDSAATTTTSALAPLVRSEYVESTLQLDASLLLELQQQSSSSYDNNRLLLLPTSKDKVRAWYVSLPSRTLKVEHHKSFDVAQVLEWLHRGGLDCRSPDDVLVLADGVKEQLFLPEVGVGTSEGDSANGGEVASQANALGVPLSVLLSGAFWVVSMAASILHWPAIELFGLVSVGCGLPPVAIKAWQAVRHRRVDANAMMALAAIGAVLLREWEEAASVAFLFALSEHLEARATFRARDALSYLLRLQPVHGRVLDPSTGRVQLVPAAHIGVGSLLQVRTGDAIVTDGIVVEGTCLVDESSLTGESRPISKSVGDPILGGSLNVGSTPVMIKTTQTSPESAVGRLVALVEQAQANNHGWTLTLIDGFARAYTPVVLASAFLLATLSWLGGIQMGRYWTYNALILIVIACPCALTIATPVAYAAGLAATAQQGIVVKGGGAVLEQLGSVSKIFFDKTGSLTEGKFQLSHLVPTEAAKSRDEMLMLVAALEAPSSHPLAGGLLEAARNGGITSESMSRLRVDVHTVVNGEGVQAQIDGTFSYAGNQRMMERLGYWHSLDRHYKDMVREWSNNLGACTIGFVAVQDRGILGLYCLTDRVRPEASQVVRGLISEGYELAMLTGDLETAARAVANHVGIPESAVYSQLLPEEKLHLVGSSLDRNQRRLFEARKVLFVGDGINDAPALATADVGVSMGEGAAVSMEMSDVTLMDSNLTKLQVVLEMGRRVRRTVRENIALSLFCKLAVVCLTFLGFMTLLYAIASDVGVMLVVTLNGMRLLPSTKELAPPSHSSLPQTRFSNDQSVRNIGQMRYSRISNAASMFSSRLDEGDELELV